MKKIKFIYSIAFLLVVAISCTSKDGINKDLAFLNTAVSGNVNKIFDISKDNSGNVKITPTGDGVTSFIVAYGHGTGSGASATVLAGGNTTHAYPEGSYTVSITATDIAGHKTTTTYPLTITYRAPEKLVVTLNQSVHNLKVQAAADFAASYLVYFGDATNEVGTPLANGAQISHDYATSGYYNVKVVALSGGAAVTDKTLAITVTDPFGLPIDFESAFINWFFGTFDDWGQQQFAKVANPYPTGLNTSAMVGMYTSGHAGWSGTYSPLDNPIDFAVGKKIKVLVYNPDPALIGKKMNVELEAAVGGTPANGVAVLKVAFTKSGAWEELVFDYSNIPGIPAGTKFKQLVLRFDDSHSVGGAIFYVDNFRLTN
jgi:hypothetical protein